MYELFRPLSSLLLSCLLCGCAVLTIDVDVYKGSLSNSDRVQEEQIGSAIGAAKPILVRLRNLLELDARNFWFIEDPADRPENAFRNSRIFMRYDGYIPPACYRFYSPQARHLNQILAEYDQPLDEDLARFLKATFPDVAPLIESFERTHAAKIGEESYEKRRDTDVKRKDDLAGYLEHKLGKRRGPSRMNEALELTLEALNAYRESGRGIDGLLEEYRQGRSSLATAKPADRRQKAANEFRKLLPQLVAFAEKLRVVGDNENLLAEQDGLLPGVLRALLRNTFAGGSDARVYVRVLQSIGNSLIYQVDELVHRQDYEDELGLSAERHRAALESAFPRDPAALLERLLWTLEVAAQRCDDPARSAEIRKTIEVVRREVGAVLKDPEVVELSRLGDRRRNRLTVMGVLHDILSRTAGTNPEYESALKVMSSLPPGLDPSSYDADSSKDAIDDLIATLQYEYLAAVRNGGKNSPEARRIAETIEAAMKQRELVAFIRPTTAYLRTSQAASTLQPDAKLGWRNMLGEHGVRQLPFASELFFRGGDLQTLLELDKQSWQNINRVRVAGAGNTNYVVAKDDIGNWYVKNYSADPGPIIESARNLAVFALRSQGIGVTANAATSAASTTGVPTPTEPSPEVTVATRQLTFFRETYDTESKATMESTIAAAKGLYDKVIATVKAHDYGAAASKEIEKALAPPRGALETVIQNQKVGPDQTYADATIAVLDAARTFHESSTRAADNLAMSDSTNLAAVRKLLKDALSEHVKRLVRTQTASLTESLERYERAVRVIDAGLR